MGRYLVTGAAGFIGSHLAELLLSRGEEVLGVDSLNDYYDVRLKQARLARLEEKPGFRFERLDIADRAALEAFFAREKPPIVVHLAAQAGVRYSLTNPHEYGAANLVGFLNVLEGCRQHSVRHLVYASSSSVYGANTTVPFRTTDRVDHPVSLYAATKKANELMAHSYSHLYGLPATGLRFFTVYGPWGRPDMVPFVFTPKILAGEPIDVFNHGKMRRDFTYVGDVVEAVSRVALRPPTAETAPQGEGVRSNAVHRVYNVGNHSPVELLHVIEVLERALGRAANKRFVPMQPGDVLETYADVEELERDVGFRPATSIETGIERFVAWYRAFYGVSA